MLVAVALVSGLLTATATASEPTPVDPDWSLVIDRAGILDEGQERSAVNDVYRLNLYGIPTQVITEPVGLNRAQAEARADELRISEGIESSQGANDGLLFYVSTDLYDQTNFVISISSGAGALPRNGLDDEALDGIREGIVADQLAFGHPARAIVYSLREMIYLEQYVPPPPPALSGWRTGAKPFVDILAPVFAATGTIWLLRGRKNRTTARRTRSARAAMWPVCGALTAGLIVIAVATRSQPAVLAAIILGGLLTWHAVTRERELSLAAPRSIRFSPRRPGSRRPARSVRTSDR